MKKHRTKEKFLEELRKTPIVQVVCEKLGVSRNTYYRWVKEDLGYEIEATKALSEGEAVVNDVAESNVLRGIQNQDKDYTKYWLGHRNPRFKPALTKRQVNVVYDPKQRDEMLKKWFVQPEPAEDSKVEEGKIESSDSQKVDTNTESAT